VIVKLPFPDPSLFPNRKNGKHWSATHAAKTEAHFVAYACAKQRMAGFSDKGGPIPLSVVFMPPDGRRRDLDNMLAAMKPALDGIADAMGIDDKRFRPILIDVGEVAKPGAVVIGVGVQIVTSGVI
jgi:crossover junction endodeoxyribonuclease RusA